MNNWIDLDYPFEVCFHGANMAVTHVPTVVLFDYLTFDRNPVYAARILPLGLTAYKETVEGAIERLKEMFRMHLDLYAERGIENDGNYGVEWYMDSDNANEVDWVCSCKLGKRR